MTKFINCRLEDIATFLRPNENVILDGINHEFALKLNSLKDASEIEADIVYEYPKSVVYPAHSLLL